MSALHTDLADLAHSRHIPDACAAFSGGLSANGDTAVLQHMQLRHGKGVAVYVVWSDWSPASACHASCVDTRYFTRLSVVHTGRMHCARFRLLQMEFGELLMLLCTSALLRLKAALVFGGCPASA